MFGCQDLARPIPNRRRRIPTEYQNFLTTHQSQALGTRAYEASRMDQSNGAPLALGGGATKTGGHGEEGLSPDHQLLCQIGNCLQLDAVSTTAWVSSRHVLLGLAYFRCPGVSKQHRVVSLLRLCSF